MVFNGEVFYETDILLLVELNFPGEQVTQNLLHVDLCTLQA
jgi:hypothetical protein